MDEFKYKKKSEKRNIKNWCGNNKDFNYQS